MRRHVHISLWNDFGWTLVISWLFPLCISQELAALAPKLLLATALIEDVDISILWPSTTEAVNQWLQSVMFDARSHRFHCTMSNLEVARMISFRRQIRRQKDQLKGISDIQSQDRDFYKNVLENNFLRNCLKRIKEKLSRRPTTVRPMKSNRINSQKSLSKGLARCKIHTRWAANTHPSNRHHTLQVAIKQSTN